MQSSYSDTGPFIQCASLADCAPVYQACFVHEISVIENNIIVLKSSFLIIMALSLMTALFFRKIDKEGKIFS